MLSNFALSPLSFAKSKNSEATTEKVAEQTREQKNELKQQRKQAKETANAAAKKEKDEAKNIAESSVSTIISSEQGLVWKTLTSFERYPQIFKRIKSSAVTKREGELVYVETYLKPAMFVKQPCQHTVNNLSASPGQLRWQQLDGNFKHIEGNWEIVPEDNNRTKVIYTLHVDAGSLVPPSMVSFFLSFVQKEVLAQLKQFVEKEKKESLKALEKPLSQPSNKLAKNSSSAHSLN
jgi:ribosome-associated toxin RatA of RatAB toxin-antitoxin module